MMSLINLAALDPLLANVGMFEHGVAVLTKVVSYQVFSFYKLLSKTDSHTGYRWAC